MPLGVSMVSTQPLTEPLSQAEELADYRSGVIDMPKGWLCDKGESGSKRRAKPQRHVVKLSNQTTVIPRIFYYVSRRVLNTSKGSSRTPLLAQLRILTLLPLCVVFQSLRLLLIFPTLLLKPSFSGGCPLQFQFSRSFSLKFSLLIRSQITFRFRNSDKQNHEQ